MNTETLVTIDDTTLTTITGGRQIDATMNPAPRMPFFGSAESPPKHSGEPAAPSTPNIPFRRPERPFATESRL